MTILLFPNKPLFLPHKVKRTVEWGLVVFGVFFVLSSMLTLLCISTSRQQTSSGEGEQLFSDEVVQQLARMKYSFQ